MLCLAGVPASADEPASEIEKTAPASESETAAPPPAASAPEALVVKGVKTKPREWTAELPEAAFESGRASDASEAIRAIPGVTGVRRGANSSEPVIRGLGWERVATRVDGLNLHGACVGRMDPPASMLSPTAIQSLEVVKDLPSVLLGPGGTGGAIEISSDYERDPDEPDPWGGRIHTTYDSAGNRFFGGVEGMGGNRWLDLHAAVHGGRAGDYDSGDGTRVPARLTGFGGSFSLAAHPAEGQRVGVRFLDGERRDEDFPALPMDSEYVSSRVVTAAWRLERGPELFRGLELRGGYNGVEHVMNNDHKPNFPRMQAETHSDADTFGTRALSLWHPAPALRLAFGLDFQHLGRDATRRRRMTLPMPMQFTDRIWPDVWQWDLGGFAALDFEIGDDWRMRLGGRVDRAESDARDADAPSLQMRSVRENYVFRNGDPGAGKVDRSQTLGSGQLFVVWEGVENLRAQLGGGLTSRTANLTELYFAFAPAPGGFLVGNPALSPEKKIEIAGGIDWSSEHVDLSIDFFHAWFEDYILPTLIDVDDVNGDGVDDLIRGFVNVNARTTGVELGLVLRAGAHWSLPVSLSYVRGRNTSDDRDLPEIPPLEGQAALRFDSGTDRFPCWLQFGGRFANRQDEIDPLFGEDATGGFVVLHLRGGVELWRGLSLQAGIENLLDREYHEHLTRETALPVGDLGAGDEIPAPGRHVYVTFNGSF
jgi:iron complex outermembrane receptor protein